MPRLSAILISFIASIGCSQAASEEVPDTIATYDAIALTAQQAREDVAIFRQTIEDVHPGYGRYTSEVAMDALFDDLQRSIDAGVSDADLYREVSRILVHLRCDHTKAELPESLEQFRRTTPTYLPFSFRLFDGRMYVDRIDETQRRLSRGDEVLRINGRPVGQILNDIESYVSVDGWTDETKRIEMEYSSEYLGDAVDHFWPLLYGWPDEWVVEVREMVSGTIREEVLKPVTYERWLEVVTDEAQRFIDFPQTVAFDVRDESTGYLSIGTFVNYRNPVPPESVFDPVFDELRESGAEHLIIDLRACGGGSDDVPASLATYLADTIVPSTKRPSWVSNYDLGDLREHLWTWDPSVLQMPAAMFRDLGNGFFELRDNVGEPRPAPARTNRFNGRVTVLSSAANASGATILIALLQEHYGARVVGEPTGGSAEGPTAGIILFLTLPHSKIKVRVPALRSWVNVEHPAPGRGVMPDVLVRPTVEDWLNQRDPVLDAAMIK